MTSFYIRVSARTDDDALRVLGALVRQMDTADKPLRRGTHGYMVGREWHGHSLRRDARL